MSPKWEKTMGEGCMKLTVLMDNHTYIDEYYLGEPAVSYLIEDGERTILFDVGYSEAFIENARRMEIDLGRVTDIVLSHGHIDHTGGLPAFFKAFTQPVRLTAHPGAFWPKRYEGMDAGSPIQLAALPKQVEVNLTEQPVQISENILYLGEIPRRFAFEMDRAVGETCACCGAEWMEDALSDDTAVALSVPEGTFVVTGCAHSGVCNTVAAAKALLPGKPIAGVFGGFHLFDAGDVLDQTIQTLQKQGADMVFPCHCTSLKVKCAFCEAFHTQEVGVGM
jgi:7,8-dihydropterin-6-yl-methyl-4-(beta-D-ribofuranosyl)aminobenzene 5'-phosphate synthase